jgi:RHS repeat-associated protein
VDWTGLNESGLLESDEYRTDMSYDGLSRPIEVTLPLDLDSQRKLVVPTYNRSGAMETISLDGEVYVSRIAYNARGQRVLMAIGDPANFSNNGGIMTRFAYDPVNFRLLRQRSERFEIPSGFPLTYEAVSGSTKQDCEYAFDLAGNIVTMTDDSPNAGVGGASGPFGRDFTYDALYRLLTATGRESGNFANSSTPWDESFYIPDNSHTNTRSYTRTYTYDQLGNMLSLNHNAGTGNTFNRIYNNNQTNPFITSNLCKQLTYGQTTVSYAFDANGNMVSEGVGRHFEWDFADQMRVYRTQTSGVEPTVFAHYLYDAGGVRVKKIVRKSTGNHEVTVYIDGVFEYLYEVTSSSTKTEEKNEIHVMDGRSLIARREVFGGTWSGSQTDAVKYVMEDHLGNASFTLTATGGAYRQEEYFPFGETSFGSYTKKRYRFCGKERDEESGLYYYGARYYMPWQCRFVSVDPLAGEYAFYTPYQYASNKPIVAIDLDGLETPEEQNTGMEADGQNNQVLSTKGMNSGEKIKLNIYVTGCEDQIRMTREYHEKNSPEENLDPVISTFFAAKEAEGSNANTQGDSAFKVLNVSGIDDLIGKLEEIMATGKYDLGNVFIDGHSAWAQIGIGGPDTENPTIGGDTDWVDEKFLMEMSNQQYASRFRAISGPNTIVCLLGCSIAGASSSQKGNSQPKEIDFTHSPQFISVLAQKLGSPILASYGVTGGGENVFKNDPYAGNPYELIGNEKYNQNYTNNPDAPEDFFHLQEIGKWMVAFPSGSSTTVYSPRFTQSGELTVETERHIESISKLISKGMFKFVW